LASAGKAWQGTRPSRKVDVWGQASQWSIG